MNRSVGVVCILVLLCATVSASASQDFFHEGIAFLRQGQFAAAAGAFSKVIDQDPSNQDALRNRGVAYIKLDKYDQAISDFEAALQVGKYNDGIYSNLGVAWYYKKEYSKAISYCDKEIEQNPRNYFAFFNRALCRAALGETDQANEDVLKSLDLSPRYYPALCLKADLLLESEERSRAIEVYKTAYGVAPDQPYAKNRLDELDVSTDDVKVVAQNPAPPQVSRPQSVSTAAVDFSVKNEMPEQEEAQKPEQLQNQEQVQEQVQEQNQEQNQDQVQTPEQLQEKNPRFALQVGGFTLKENAERMMARLSAKGLSPRTLELDRSDGTHWYLIRVGAYESEDFAKDALEQTREMVEFDVVIRPYGQF